MSETNIRDREKKKPPDKKPKKRKFFTGSLGRAKKTIDEENKESTNRAKIISFFKKAVKSSSNELVKKESLENIKKFIGMKQKIGEWKKDPNQAKKDRKIIMEMAKKLLIKEELDSLPQLKKDGDLKNLYTPAIALLDIRFHELEELLNKDKLKKEELNMTQEEFDQAMKIYETELKNFNEEEEEEEEDEEEIITDPVILKHKQDIKELEEAWDLPFEDIIKELEKNGIDLDKMDLEEEDVKKEKEEDKILEDPAVLENLSKFIDNVDEKEIIEEIKPEVKEEIQKINNGEIKINVEKEDKIKNLSVIIEERQKRVTESMNLLKLLNSWNQPIGKLENTDKNLLKEWINGKQMMSLDDTVDKILKEMYQNKELTRNEILLSLAIKLLFRELTTVRDLVKSLMGVIDIKDSEDKEKKKFEKRPGIIKKIEAGNYLPKEEMVKLTNVNKALRNLKDFVQMPKWHEWIKFKDEEKKAFVDERIKWNISRLGFLINSAKGIEDKSFTALAAHEIPKALHCQVYYMDKFESGFRIKKEEWKKLYFDGQTKEIKKKIAQLRVEAKSILLKCEKDDKLSGYIKYKGQWINSRGMVYWKIKLESIFKKLIEQQKLAMPWKFGVKNIPYANKRKDGKYLNKKKERGDGEEDIGDERNFL